MTVNGFTDYCKNIKNGQKILLSGEEVFDIWSDNCLVVDGYYFSNTSSLEENPLGRRPTFIHVKGKKDIVIDGNGAKILIHGVITPFIFDNCENVEFRNFEIDYARPTMSEFLILENDGRGNCLIEVSKDSLYEVRNGRLVWVGECGKNGENLWECDYRGEMSIALYNNPKTEEVIMMEKEDGVRFPCIPAFKVLADEGDGKLRIKLENEKAFFPVGCVIQTRNTVRDQIGGAFINSKKIHCENLIVNAMHGFGILSQYCDSVTFSKIRINPPIGRTNASNADFLHFSGCKGEIKIEGCVMSYGHDDFINVHGTHLIITEKNGSFLKVKFMNAYSRGFKAFFEGDEIDFIDRKTLIPYGNAKVKSVEMISDTEFIIETDQENNAKLDDAVENATWTPSVIIKNNKFGPSMGRGILCTTRRKVAIENNIFYKTGGSVLCLEDDCNFWYESGYIADLTFRNNTVIGCAYGSLGCGNPPVIDINPQVIDKTKDIYVHKKIAIENNEFKNLPENAYSIEVKNTENFIYKGNKSDKEIKFTVKSVKNAEIE